MFLQIQCLAASFRVLILRAEKFLGYYSISSRGQLLEEGSAELTFKMEEVSLQALWVSVPLGPSRARRLA